MSLAVVPVNSVKVLDPRTKINESKEYAILQGGSTITPVARISNTYSNQSIQFSCPPPNPGIITARSVYLQVPMRFTFSGTLPFPAGKLLQLGLNDAPRAFPVARAINTLTVTINNSQVSINMNDVIDALVRYQLPAGARDSVYSASPSMLDQYQSYDDYKRFGVARNALGNYGDNAVEAGRGGFVPRAYTDVDGAGAATVDYIFTEALILPPFTSGEQLTSGFLGVQTMDFNFSLGDLKECWSHNPAGNTVTLQSAIIYDSPKLLFTYITPNLIEKIPAAINYSYSDIARYITEMKDPVNQRASFTVTSTTMQLSSIPRRIIVCVRRTNSARSMTTTDTFARVDNVSVNWNNQSGLLSACTTQQLYNMSVENGLKLNWQQANRHVGYPLCLEFGKDIGLLPQEAPGLQGTYNLQMNVTFTNVADDGTAAANPTQFALYLIVISEGIFTIMENRSISQIGVMSKQEILDSKSSPTVDYHTIQQLGGGSFFSNIPSFLGRVINGAVDTVNKVAPVALPIAKALAPVVGPMLGLGDANPRMARRLMGVGLDFSNQEDEAEEDQRRDLLRQKKKKAKTSRASAGAGAVSSLTINPSLAAHIRPALRDMDVGDD